MQFLDLSLTSPAHDLACDEALLDLCESGYDGEILRCWQPREPYVVLGYTNPIHDDVNLAACAAQNVPVLRRTTGGGTVLQGPGCLNYALILRLAPTGPLSGITETNAYIMQRQRAAIAGLLDASVAIQGVTDLTRHNLKFSGNAQRRRRRFLLFHGTFLLNFDLPRVAQLLQLPARQPQYRQGRAHDDFLTNLHLPAAVVSAALKKTWDAAELFQAVPFQRIESLVQEKYTTPEWTFKF